MQQLITGLFFVV